jgi:Tol biopolymer transport system component
MRIRTKGWLAAALMGLGLPAYAQNFSAWSSAVNLGPVVNGSAAEGCPFIAKSELTLYVVSTRAGGYGGQDIYVSQRDSVYDLWGPLQNLGPVINSPGNDLCPTLAIDGHRLFFVSDRPGGHGKQDLYVARRQNKRDDFGWDAPMNLGSGVNSAENDFTPSLLEDDRTGLTVLYFGSDRPGGMGDVDIYSSSLNTDGNFEWPVLVPELSTEFIDERPNIRKDGLEIYFDSNRPGSLGSTDLWVSTRDSTEAPWSLPVNLGPAVNSAAAEIRPSLAFDGATLYFNSTRPGGQGGSDIYVVSRTRIQGPQ